MKSKGLPRKISRRQFLKYAAAGMPLPFLAPFAGLKPAAGAFSNDIFWITDIPNQPFLGRDSSGNCHAGIDSLLHYMGRRGLKFYRSSRETISSGPTGLIEPHDVVLIKVNAQWKYRGCTNSDLIRGLIQRVLDHPDGFAGEVVIFENGQGSGSLNCDYYGDSSVHANANDESHTFLFLRDVIFKDSRVSAYLLDPIRATIINADDHATQGYRLYENVSYPCFTTPGGRRVELREGIWQGSTYTQNLKLINVPVLKHHDEGGSEITAALKHFYGVVSMQDGQAGFRHYSGLGETCGKMAVSVRPPVLNIVDAIWVSFGSLAGTPASATFRANHILASQDPVALDYIAAKHVLYPIDNNPRHHPDFPGINRWLTDALTLINSRGGIYNAASGISVGLVTKNENEMSVLKRKCRTLYNFNLRAT